MTDSIPRSNEDLLRDLELTQRDEARLVAIVDNLQDFITDCGEEDRSRLKVHLLMFEAFLVECRGLLGRIASVVEARGLAPAKGGA